MKHTAVKIISALLLLSVIGVLLISCGGEPKSAYDVAVSNGFVGTEKQWLESLKGQDLDIVDIYEKAVDAGYTGDFLSFLTEYLDLDPAMLADAIAKYQEKDTSHAIALSLLSSVSISCPGSITTGGGKSGSGVIVSLEKNNGNAYILTNYHVVMQYNAAGAPAANAIYVYLYGDDQNAITARYIGGSYTYDLAVLQISGSERIRSSSVVPVSPADSDLIVAGTDAIAIGNNAGLGISVTHGIVSIDSKHVSVTKDGMLQRLIQIDTPVNEGNSGGGLFNANGELIGLVSAKLNEEGMENIGYAIPSNIAVRAAKRIIADFKASNNDHTVNPVPLKVMDLGIATSASNPHAVYDTERNVTTITETVKISGVALGSLAKANGLKSGDVLKSIEVDGTLIPIVREFSYHDALMLCKAGSTVTIRFTRDGTSKTVTFQTPTSEYEIVV